MDSETAERPQRLDPEETRKRVVRECSECSHSLLRLQRGGVRWWQPLLPLLASELDPCREGEEPRGQQWRATK